LLGKSECASKKKTTRKYLISQKEKIEAPPTLCGVLFWKAWRMKNRDGRSKKGGRVMGAVDRIIFGIIALALMLIALQPLFADAGRDATKVDIVSIGGYSIRGSALPVK
jgi:hypothetical protein